MDDRKSRRALSKRPKTTVADNEVGYGKPPVHTRFKPGQSGNARGRPKGSKPRPAHVSEPLEERLKGIVLEEAYRPLTVRDGDDYVQIPTIRAVLRSVALKAAQGHQRSQKMFADLVGMVEGEQRLKAEQLLETAIEYKIDWERELEHRERTGQTGPEPLPHPGDIVIHSDTGRVEILGPMTKEDKAIWDRLPEMAEDMDETFALFEKLVEQGKGSAAIRRTLRKMRDQRARIAYLLRE